MAVVLPGILRTEPRPCAWTISSPHTIALSYGERDEGRAAFPLEAYGKDLISSGPLQESWPAPRGEFILRGFS